MASRVIIVDDLDGSEGAATVQFSIEGTAYEVDLGEANTVKLREALEPYVRVGRKVGGSSPRRATSSDSGVDIKAVKAWAASNGIDVPQRGRVPQRVIQQYKDAGN